MDRPTRRKGIVDPRMNRLADLRWRSRRVRWWRFNRKEDAVRMTLLILLAYENLQIQPYPSTSRAKNTPRTTCLPLCAFGCVRCIENRAISSAGTHSRQQHRKYSGFVISKYPLIILYRQQWAEYRPLYIILPASGRKRIQRDPRRYTWASN